ncbi:MAG: sulfurtransferase, partial [Sulfuricella sp.]|nr:sulfurtransferase [Sulfuricella sp.]
MFKTLISTEQLAQHLDSPDWVVFDCRFTLTDAQAGRHAYAAGHIPGARYAHLDEDLASAITPTTGRHPLPDPQALAQKLGAWGVGATTQVVVYDDSFGSMAVRLWWLLRWLGHDAVALLNGGLPRWHREKRPLTEALPTIAAQSFTAHPDRNIWVDAGEVEAARHDRTRLILDARPEIRFTGDMEPLDKVAGHIPCSCNWSFEENLDMDGTLLPIDELRVAYENLLDGRPPHSVIHTCGSGVTAC